MRQRQCWSWRVIVWPDHDGNRMGWAWEFLVMVLGWLRSDPGVRCSADEGWTVVEGEGCEG